MVSPLKFIKKNLVGLGLTVASIAVVLLLHRLHVFQNLDLKAVDFAFRVRGPLSGWTARNEIPKDSLDVVLVDIDDETYRLAPWTWPYPRDVWARVVQNLSRAGAKVVVFDIQFDAPEARSEHLKGVRRELLRRGMRDLVPVHGDSIFAKAIREVQSAGTSVIIASKIVDETTSYPPQSLVMPNDIILSGSPTTGLVDEPQDADGFTRRYYVFNRMRHEPDQWYWTLGMRAVQKFIGFPDDAPVEGDVQKGRITWGPLTIPTYGRDPMFLINFYGPPSASRAAGLDPWKTFNRYPLSSVIDVMDVDLKNPDEDSDWMEYFMLDSPFYGLLGESPFKDKIVMVGVSVEVLHDTKYTPFFAYRGEQQLMPGVEVHANAVQTVLDKNFISVFGSEIGWSYKSWKSHMLLIGGLSLVAFLLLAFMNPLFAGLSIVAELLVFLSVGIGAFTQDGFWLVKGILQILLPDGWLDKMGEWVIVNTPGFGDSTIIPISSPVMGIFLTYGSNVLYRFIMEQKDKRFLKHTFGTYVSPELIDRMYEAKQEPKLGGDAGYHTAFFSDIQSFSSFSEVLEPEKMVSLMNEYLTEMTEILLSHRGTLDKYIGDAIVAFYGAPMPVEDHEYQACITALEMERRLKELRHEWSNNHEWPGIVHHMRHRIGLNSGEMVTGNMGSNMRMNYTMMGDTVNIAARLEASAKQYGIYIQVAENTFKAVKDRFEWRFLDNVRVKGKKRPVKVYELLAEKGNLDDTYQKLLPLFHEGMELYEAQKWDEALKVFTETEKLEEMFPMRPTNPSRVYMERCRFLKENPPGEDWDGVWTLTKK
ncbi:MAG: CHASE2 domain-containing protein [Fidelibacterota bacterium]